MMASALNDCERRAFDKHKSTTNVVESYRADVVHIHDKCDSPRLATSIHQLYDITAIFHKKIATKTNDRMEFLNTVKEIDFTKWQRWNQAVCLRIMI